MGLRVSLVIQQRLDAGQNIRTVQQRSIHSGCMFSDTPHWTLELFSDKSTKHIVINSGDVGDLLCDELQGRENTLGNHSVITVISVALVRRAEKGRQEFKQARILLEGDSGTWF